jgi:hypothetical protein
MKNSINIKSTKLGKVIKDLQDKNQQLENKNNPLK